MLDRLYVDNYKCLVNFEIRPDDVTLLLGPNGVGKSAVVDVLFALRQLLSGAAKPSDAVAFPTRTLTRWERRPTQVVEVGATVGGEPMTYRLELQHEVETRRVKVALERLTTPDATLFTFENGEVGLYDDHGRAGARFHADWNESFLARVVPGRENRRLTRFLEFIRKIVICGVYPHGILPESSTEDAMLARDGSNFCSWYRHLAQERLDLVPRYTAALGEVVEGFQALRLEKIGEETRALAVDFVEGAGRYALRLDELSDGQRTLLVLYALLHLTRGQGYTLVLDEPDNYLALGEIQPWLIELADACGEGIEQAILSSHHPEIIDYLGADHGLLLQRRAAGPVTIRRASQEGLAGSGLRLSEVIARGWEQ